MASKNVSDFLNQISITLPGSETEPTYTESPSTVDTTRKLYIAPKSEKIPENVVSFTPRETPPLEKLDMGSEPKLTHKVPVPLKDKTDDLDYGQSTEPKTGSVLEVNRWEDGKGDDFLYGVGNEVMNWLEEQVNNIDEWAAQWNESSDEWCSKHNIPNPFRINPDGTQDILEQGLAQAKQQIRLKIQSAITSRNPYILDSLNEWGISYNESGLNFDTTQFVSKTIKSGINWILNRGDVVDGGSNIKTYLETLTEYVAAYAAISSDLKTPLDLKFLKTISTVDPDFGTQWNKDQYEAKEPPDNPIIPRYKDPKGLPSDGTSSLRPLQFTECEYSSEDLKSIGLINVKDGAKYSNFNITPRIYIGQESLVNPGNPNHLKYTYLDNYDENTSLYKLEPLKKEGYVNQPHQYEHFADITLQSGYQEEKYYDNIYKLQNTLRSNKLLHGYSSMSGFQFGSNHNWKIKIKPYLPTAKGISEYRKVAPPELPLYTTINPKTGNRVYKSFGEDCPVLSYSFNMGSIRTETFRLFNSASHEVFAGVNFNMILTLSILDDVHGSMMKYMLKYMNFAYNPSAGTLRPFYELLFEIELVILEATGGGINHHMKLIGIPIDYAPMLDGSQDPNETRVDIVMSIVGMIPYKYPDLPAGSARLVNDKGKYVGIQWKDIQSNMISDDDRVNTYLPGAANAVKDGFIAAQEIAVANEDFLKDAEKKIKDKAAKDIKEAKDGELISAVIVKNAYDNNPNIEVVGESIPKIAADQIGIYTNKTEFLDGGKIIASKNYIRLYDKTGKRVDGVVVK